MQISFEMVSNAHVRQLCPLNIHWRQDSLVYPACWILIGQFKFQARQPYARGTPQTTRKEQSLKEGLNGVNR